MKNQVIDLYPAIKRYPKQVTFAYLTVAFLKIRENNPGTQRLR
jgi:hypothetical protein